MKKKIKKQPLASSFINVPKETISLDKGLTPKQREKALKHFQTECNHEWNESGESAECIHCGKIYYPPTL